MLATCHVRRSLPAGRLITCTRSAPSSGSCIAATSFTSRTSHAASPHAARPTSSPSSRYPVAGNTACPARGDRRATAATPRPAPPRRPGCRPAPPLPAHRPGGRARRRPSPPRGQITAGVAARRHPVPLALPRVARQRHALPGHHRRPRHRLPLRPQRAQPREQLRALAALAPQRPHPPPPPPRRSRPLPSPRWSAAGARSAPRTRARPPPAPPAPHRRTAPARAGCPPSTRPQAPGPPAPPPAPSTASAPQPPGRHFRQPRQQLPRSASTCGLWLATSTFTRRQNTPRLLQLAQHLAQRARIAGQHRLPRPVAHRDADLPAPRADRGRRLRHPQLHQRHLALPAQPLHQPAPSADHARRVRQAQRPRHVRRRHLAHAVPEHPARLHAPRRATPPQAPPSPRTAPAAPRRSRSSATRRPTRPSPRAPPPPTTPSPRGSPRRTPPAARRNAGSLANSSRPIPAHCHPCPGITNTTSPALRSTALPRTTVAAASPPAAAAASAAAAATRLSATTASRSPSSLRVVARHATPPSHQRPPRPAVAPAGSPPARQLRREPPGRLGHRRLVPRRHHQQLGSRASPPSMPPAAPARGASSTITCAFVPLIPNELTPAYRGLSPRGHARAAVASASAVPSSRISGLRARKFRVPRDLLVMKREDRLHQLPPRRPPTPGDRRWSSPRPARTTSHQRARPRAPRAAPRSRSDPRARSRAVRLDEPDRRRARAGRAGRLAEQRLLRQARWARSAPSSPAVLVPPQPRTTAQTRDRRRRPRPRGRLSANSRAALARPRRSPARRSVLQRPSRATAPRRRRPGPPPSSQRRRRPSSADSRQRAQAVTRPTRKLYRQARWTATGDEEHAVSTVRARPESGVRRPAPTPCKEFPVADTDRRAPASGMQIIGELGEEHAGGRPRSAGPAAGVLVALQVVSEEQALRIRALRLAGDQPASGDRSGPAARRGTSRAGCRQAGQHDPRGLRRYRRRASSSRAHRRRSAASARHQRSRRLLGASSGLGAPVARCRRRPPAADDAARAATSAATRTSATGTCLAAQPLRPRGLRCAPHFTRTPLRAHSPLHAHSRRALPLRLPAAHSHFAHSPHPGGRRRLLKAGTAPDRRPADEETACGLFSIRLRGSRLVEQARSWRTARRARSATDPAQHLADLRASCSPSSNPGARPLAWARSAWTGDPPRPRAPTSAAARTDTACPRPGHGVQPPRSCEQPNSVRGCASQQPEQLKLSSTVELSPAQARPASTRGDAAPANSPDAGREPPLAART